MIPLSLTSSPSVVLILKPRYSPSPGGSIQTRYNQLKNLKQQQRRSRDGKCRAEFSADAPVAMAIGACLLNSLVFPPTPSREDLAAESLIDSSDARFAVMGVISFIPYFNWMSWVFAWLDTGKRRYAVYAIVYLAPYLRSNLSLSPEESWLPIASILLCILHIQLEASIKDGDVQGFQVLNQAAKLLSSIMQKKNTKEFDAKEGEKDFYNMLSEGEGYSNEVQDWTTGKSFKDHEELNDDKEDNENAKRLH
ncbi:hypothetical protein OROGR_005526 [Orobanche gracilis]